MTDIDEEIENKKKWKKIRIRNLKINIAKVLIKSEQTERKIFNRNELKELFSMKESDLAFVVEDLFDLDGENYIINCKMDVFLDKVFNSNKAVRKYLSSAESEFLRIYGRYYENAEKNLYRNSSHNDYATMYNALKDVIPIIHWGKLPLLNKYLIYNREMDPETEILEFYDHPDSLNVLLNEIRNRGMVLSNKSDFSLNKKMNFKVYTRRWGHEDCYTITRVIDGWNCPYFSNDEKCKKNGEGALFMNLDHDSVFFPRDGVAYAMQKLWEDADEGEIDFEELSKRIQQIADWISAVEKSVSTQPDWVNYY